MGMGAATVGMGAAILKWRLSCEHGGGHLKNGGGHCVHGGGHCGVGAVPMGRKPSLWDILYGMGRSLRDGDDLYGMKIVIMGWRQPLWDGGGYYGMRTVPKG